MRLDWVALLRALEGGPPAEAPGDDLGAPEWLPAGSTADFDGLALPVMIARP